VLEVLAAEHPAIRMGLIYCLRFYWSGNEDHAGICSLDQQLLERTDVGWMGPESWQTNVRGVHWFGSLYLVDDDISDPDVLSKRKQLPRIVAHPCFHGSPRYDFVSIRLENEGI
jgi:hypothetical protein